MDVVKLLQDAGADEMLDNKASETALDVARKNHHDAVVEVLMDGRIPLKPALREEWE